MDIKIRLIEDGNEWVVSVFNDEAYHMENFRAKLTPHLQERVALLNLVEADTMLREIGTRFVFGGIPKSVYYMHIPQEELKQLREQNDIV